MNFMQNANKLISLIKNDHLGHWSPEFQTVQYSVSN